ncbi:unnamed protein product, partial [Scytosiphon promiscuus]
GGTPTSRPHGAIVGGGGGGAGSKRKPRHSATQDSPRSSGAVGGGGSRKRARATDPWEDILGALNPHEVLDGRSAGIPGESGSSSGRRSPTESAGAESSSGGGPIGAPSAATNPVHSLPWLQLLAAILEAYPGGGCWCPQDTASELARAVTAAEVQLKSTTDPSVH